MLKQLRCHKMGREPGGLTLVFRWLHTLVNYSKFKNTPKALISGQKSTLILKKKRWLFPVKKHSLFYQNTDIGWTGTRTLTLDFIILCLFSGSRFGRPRHFGSHSASDREYFVDCKVIFTPHTSYLGTKKYHSFTNPRTCGGPLYLIAPSLGSQNEQKCSFVICYIIYCKGTKWPCCSKLNCLATSLNTFLERLHNWRWDATNYLNHIYMSISRSRPIYCLHVCTVKVSRLNLCKASPKCHPFFTNI